MPRMDQFLTEEFPKPISIDVGATYSFRNFKEIEEWCDNEIIFFNSLNNPENIVHQFKVHIKDNIGNIFRQNRSDDFKWDDLSKEIIQFIESTSRKDGFIFSRSNNGRFLTKLKEKNPSLVLGAYKYFQQKIKRNDPSLIQRDGEFAAYLFEIGLEPNFEEEKKKYSEFYKEITEQKDSLLAELIKVKSENFELNKQIQSQKEAWDKKFETQKGEVEKKFNTEYDRHKAKMEESEKFYDSELALKKAVTYWTDKAQGHKENSIIFGVASGILMLAAIISIYLVGGFIVGLDISDDKGIGKRLLTDTGAFQIWVYAFFVFSITMIVWIVRLLVKIFLSNLHLLSDAKERETMIMTYLALEREEQVVNKEDKNLILPSIFRTSSNGIIKDDSSPNPILNFFTKSPNG